MNDPAITPCPACELAETTEDNWPDFIAGCPGCFDRAVAEIRRLRRRLEMDRSKPFDGIDARDETIRQLHLEYDRLAGELRHFRAP